MAEEALIREVQGPFLIVETLDVYRWLQVPAEAAEMSSLLTGIRDKPVAETLPPIPVEWIPDDAHLQISDFPIFRTTLKCLSRRARKALEELMSPNGEWLELKGLDGEYSAFHCLRQVDCLDTDAVEAEKNKNPLFSFGSKRYVPTLRAAALEPHDVFRVPQAVNKFFVSAEFKHRYFEHGLDGLDFFPVSLR